jgi:molecular chaperone HtpG
VRVDLLKKPPLEKQREANYSIEVGEKAEPGTQITLFLKDDEKEFASSFRIKSVIKKYADHIAIPVYMPVEAQFRVRPQSQS